MENKINKKNHIGGEIMKENKKGYVKPKVRFIYYSEWDVITMSSGANYLTDGEYDEENLWGGFGGWD